MQENRGSSRISNRGGFNVGNYLLLKMSDMLRVKTEVLLRKKKKKWFLCNQDTVTSSAQKSGLPAEAGGVTTRAGRPGAQG